MISLDLRCLNAVQLSINGQSVSFAVESGYNKCVTFPLLSVPWDYNGLSLCCAKQQQTRGYQGDGDDDDAHVEDGHGDGDDDYDDDDGHVV